RPNQDVSLVSRTNHADTDGIAHSAVTKVSSPQTRSPRHGRGSQDSLEEVTASNPHGLVIIVSPNRFLFWCQVHLILSLGWEDSISRIRLGRKSPVRRTGRR